MVISRFRGVAYTSAFVLALTLAVISASCSSGSTGSSPQGAPTAAETGPAISINPNTGGAGTEIAVKGQNWEKGEKVVISIGKPNADSVGAFGGTVVKDDGSFETSFALPAGPHRGDELVVVAHTSDYRLKAMASFHVTK
ncbi:MAG: hypothetical protein M1358_05200 [Chloroflexi bacterium]|nr:hypothetical protein [Chloroflexota bacterium]